MSALDWKTETIIVETTYHYCLVGDWQLDVDRNDNENNHAADTAWKWSVLPTVKGYTLEDEGYGYAESADAAKAAAEAWLTKRLAAQP